MHMDSIQVHRCKHTGRVLFVHVMNENGVRVASLPCTRIELDSQGDGNGEFRLTMRHNHVRFIDG